MTSPVRPRDRDDGAIIWYALKNWRGTTPENRYELFTAYVRAM